MAIIVTANLGRGVDTEEFLRNVEAIDEEAGAGAIIGFQEIDEADAPDEHSGLRKVFGKRFGFVGFDTRVPIAYGPKWQVLEDRIIRAAPGMARLSPARVINDVVFRHENGAELAVLNVHFPRNDARLLSRWLSVEAKLERRVWHHVGHGRTVVFLGDFNRKRLHKMHPHEHTLAHKGLDHIRAVELPGSTHLVRTDDGVIDLTVDNHNAQWARVDVIPPK